jgi:hypothetical protein
MTAPPIVRTPLQKLGSTNPKAAAELADQMADEILRTGAKKPGREQTKLIPGNGRTFELKIIDRRSVSPTE